MHKGTTAQAQPYVTSNLAINSSFYISNIFRSSENTRYGDMGSISHESHFKKTQDFEADYADAKFTQYESKRTGLRVTVVDRKGPKVYGYFAVATEIHDDSGSREFANMTVFRF